METAGVFNSNFNLLTGINNKISSEESWNRRKYLGHVGCSSELNPS